MMKLSSQVHQSATASDFCSLVLDQVDDLSRVQALYDNTYRSADIYPFPGYRLRHPCLRHLCGVYPLTPHLPPWWQEVLTLAPTPLVPLLANLSGTEFLAGQLDSEHSTTLKGIGKARKEEEHTTPAWARSPKLGRLLQGFLRGGETHPLYKQFVDRGSSASLSILVSCHPFDVITMGTSPHFSSCQHLVTGSEKYRLPANLLDAGMAIVYVADPLSDRWQLDRIRSRVVLRLLKDGQERVGILIDRFYGDSGHRHAMQALLTSLIGQAGLPIWQPKRYKEQGGYRTFAGTPFRVGGLPQEFADYSYPYLDQPFSWSRIARTQRWHLSGEVVEITSF